MTDWGPPGPAACGRRRPGDLHRDIRARPWTAPRSGTPSGSSYGGSRRVVAGSVSRRGRATYKLVPLPGKPGADDADNRATTGERGRRAYQLDPCGRWWTPDRRHDAYIDYERTGGVRTVLVRAALTRCWPRPPRAPARSPGGSHFGRPLGADNRAVGTDPAEMGPMFAGGSNGGFLCLLGPDPRLYPRPAPGLTWGDPPPPTWLGPTSAATRGGGGR